MEITCYTSFTVPSPFDSILEAVLTVSPNKQYLGILLPTTPAHTGPRRVNVLFIKYLSFLLV